MTAALGATQAINAANSVGNLLEKSVIINEQAHQAILNEIREMRDWECDRFNTMIDGFHKVLDKMEEQNTEINDLKSQVAGLQSKLYKEEKKSLSLVR